MFKRISILLAMLYVELFALNVEYYYDETSKMGIEDIADMHFQKSKNPFTYGYKEGDAWFKITVENKTQTDELVLFFSEPIWAKFDLYTQDPDGWKISHAGLMSPLKTREVSAVNPAFLLSIPLGEKRVYYINAQTVSGQLGEFSLLDHEAYHSAMRFSLSSKYLLVSSMLIVVLILNLYLLYRRREKIYVYYVGYIASFSVWILILSGNYLLFDCAPWNEGLHAMGTVMVLFLALFSSEYLELKQSRPKIYQLFELFFILFILLAILITLQVPYSSVIFNIVSSIFFMILFIVSIIVYKEGQIKMRYYLLALFVYMPSMALMTLTFNNMIDNTIVSRYAFVFGSIVEILLFNSLLISRYSEVAIEATRDTLSGLYNRRYFNEYSTEIFEKYLLSGEKFAVLMFDIDDFKKINDTYGHGVGDMVIKSCSKILLKRSDVDDVVARYGGEEFIILMLQEDKEIVKKSAERMRESIENSHVIVDKTRRIEYTISIGIAHLSSSDKNILGLIERADTALYQAKDEGKNKVVVF